MITDKILLGHGSGGALSHELISSLFFRYFNNCTLTKHSDSAIIPPDRGSIAFTTDSYVVDPIFFPGGDIGKLAICGTVNDLAVSGAIPKYLSASFIIEEGFGMEELERIVKSMADEAKKAKVKIVTGDTKVVDKGKADKIFINTSGIGMLNPHFKQISYGTHVTATDKIIINASIGNHGMAVMKARELEKFTAEIVSDCSCLHSLISESLQISGNIKWMRDATRGGLATVLAELVKNKTFGLEIDEDKVFVRDEVRGMCELIGFDPLYVANEGVVVMVVSEEDAEKVLVRMKKNPLGKDAAIIGELVNQHPGKAVLKTVIGGKRILDMLAGEQLPRIC